MRCLRISVFFFLFFNLIIIPAYPQSLSADYLFEIGKIFYTQGRYEEALHEFKKALMVSPNHKLAKDFINKIYQTAADSQPAVVPTISLPALQPPVKKEIQPVPVKQRTELTRQDLLELTMNNLEQQSVARAIIPEAVRAEKETRPGQTKVSGEVVLSAAVTPGDQIWNQAEGNLNEENWRSLSYIGPNRGPNTYDPRIYDRLRINVDKDNPQGLGFHVNLTNDPWSYIGKSDKFTITGASPLTDTAEFELYAWGNSKYTVGHSVFTDLRGDAFSVPETKMLHRKEVPAVTLTSLNGNIFTIPASEINYIYQPLRELWFDYKQEGLNFRFFPIAYQDQALTSDDPLKLSNNHIWWEESPWLNSWLPGHLNTPLGDFFKGIWDDSLSFYSRDSDLTRLTALRGLSFSYQPQDETSFSTTVASPKTLWQDYDSFDNIAAATRLKHLLRDNFSIGSTYTFRVGFNEDIGDKKDFTNHVIGVDLGYEIATGLKISAEAAQSFSEKDLSSPDYASESRGNAYYFSLTGRFPLKSIMDLQYGYDEIKPLKEERFFGKSRLFFAHMDRGFDPSLSTYRATRNDAFWSRHIHFKKPFGYYYSGIYYPSLKWEDIEPFRIGSGIDIGRDVIGWRLENSLWEKRIENLFDVRNVHRSNGKFLENVVRDELTYKINERLTGKLLGIYQKMPHTRGGYDPFIVDSDTGEYLKNAFILDGEDPSLKTGSLGLEYAFYDWLSLNGTWEHTNDYTAAYDHFPRGNLVGSTFATYTNYGKIYRVGEVFLYSQDLFPLPPYPFYDIFKAGLRIAPWENIEIYLDYTRNEYKSAGQIDDNVNHVGFELAYMPNKKIGLYLRYVYSRWNDLTLMTQGYNKVYLGNHNFSSEFRYMPSDDDEFVLQYGESGRTAISTLTLDPYGTSLPTLDTQHIFRLYYRRKF